MCAAREGGDALTPRRCAQVVVWSRSPRTRTPPPAARPPGVPPQPPTRQARAGAARGRGQGGTLPSSVPARHAWMGRMRSVARPGAGEQLGSSGGWRRDVRGGAARAASAPWMDQCVPACFCGLVAGGCDPTKPEIYPSRGRGVSTGCYAMSVHVFSGPEGRCLKPRT
jgi:hypothetical protein